MPYKIEKSVTLDGQPFAGAEVDIVSGSSESIIAPSLTVVSPSGDGMVVDGTTLTRVTSDNSVSAITSDFTVDFTGDEDGVFIVQFTCSTFYRGIGFTDNPNGFRGDNAILSNYSDQDYMYFWLSHNNVDATTPKHAYVGDEQSGTFLYNAATKTIKVFRTDGSEYFSYTIPSHKVFTAPMYFSALLEGGQSIPDDSLQIHFRLEDMPYSLSAGDLGTYLETNSNIKTLTSSTIEPPQSLGRTTTDANGLFSVNVGEYSSEVFASVLISGIKPQVKRFTPEVII